MKKWLKMYFDFSQRELNGIMVLLALTVLITAVPYVYDWMVPEKEIVPEEIAALKELLLIEAKSKQRTRYKETWKAANRLPTKRTAPNKLFRFDPNTTSLSEWQLLGLSEKQAQVMLRYIYKGGRFKNKEDLQKMYVISAENYERFAPYIYIKYNRAAVADTFSRKERKPHFPVKSATVIVALNAADSLELQQIKGVGPAFARRIIKYRERLGGFHSKEQLKEVFGMDSARYEQIKGQLSVDSRQLKVIAINKAGFDEFRQNPYLDYKQINALLQYRKQHGNYGNIADLKKVAILPAAAVEKLAPYISFEHD